MVGVSYQAVDKWEKGGAPDVELLPILQDLSLQFKKGGKYALTGPSGCGKSTLLKLLLGWLPDYSGAIRFDGKGAKDFTPEQLQQQMSYIEQNVSLFNSTIWDNITLGETFTDQQMEKALRDSALMSDLASMPDGLDTTKCAQKRLLNVSHDFLINGSSILASSKSPYF